MAMRPEDIEALLAQMQQGGGNPLANAIGKFSGQQPGLGGQTMGPGAMPQSPMPMPPAPLPKMGADRNMMPVPPPEQLPGGPTGLPPGYQSPNDIPEDEAMLDQVQQGMGGGEGDDQDMQAESDALVQMYSEGDPSDSATLEQWRAAKDAFIAKYGEENLPDLPNDPDTGGDDEYGSGDAKQDIAMGGEEGESQRQQSTGEFESFRKRHRRTIS